MAGQRCGQSVLHADGGDHGRRHTYPGSDCRPSMKTFADLSQIECRPTVSFEYNESELYIESGSNAEKA